MKKLALTILLLLLVGACAGPQGVIFSEVRAPGQFRTGETTNPGQGLIRGEACAFSVLGLVAMGDWSIDAALAAAGAEGKTLKNVAVDHRTLNIVGLYVRHCTLVSARVAD